MKFTLPCAQWRMYLHVLNFLIYHKLDHKLTPPPFPLFQVFIIEFPVGIPLEDQGGRRSFSMMNGAHCVTQTGAKMKRRPCVGKWVSMAVTLSMAPSKFPPKDSCTGPCTSAVRPVNHSVTVLIVDGRKPKTQNAQTIKMTPVYFVIKMVRIQFDQLILSFLSKLCNNMPYLMKFVSVQIALESMFWCFIENSVYNLFLD